MQIDPNEIYQNQRMEKWSETTKDNESKGKWGRTTREEEDNVPGRT